MAVVAIDELAQERSGSFKVSGQETMLHRHYRIKTDSEHDDPATIFDSGVLPAKASLHPHSPWAVADVYTFRQHPKSAFVWDVTIDYSSVSGGSLPQAKEIEPTLRVAEVTWDGMPVRKPLLKAFKQDENGTFGAKPESVSNSAGVAYNPPPEIDQTNVIITIKKNLTQPPAWVMQYSDAVNNDAVTIDGFTFSPGQLKMHAPHIGPVRLENFYTYREMRLVLHARRKGWDIEIQDAGYETLTVKEVKTSVGTGTVRSLKPIEDAPGTRARTPGNLDGKGKLLPKGQDPVFLVYRPEEYVRLPFAPIIYPLL